MARIMLLVVSLSISSGILAQTSLPTLAQLDPGWNAIATDGLCSSGTPFQFFAKTSTGSDNLLIYFNGGGACWFGQACDLNSQPNVHSPFADMDSNNPAMGGGIFASDRTENPFQNYDMVFIPYCTGDVHIGAGEQFYSYINAEGGEVTINTYHNGYENSSRVLNWVYENFESADRVVIGGSSAGAIGSSFYAGMVAEHFSDVPVVLLADAAGGYNSPSLSVTLSAWNTAAILPDWPEYAGETNDTLTFEDFYVASANHSPNLTIAQYNTAEDDVQYNFSYLIGDSPGSFSLAQRIFNHYIEIESGVDEFYSYTAGGTVHTILRSPIFYDYTVEGIRFVDWVDALINGRSVSDVSCVNEANGCSPAPGE